jgi:hypothetical protein
LQSDIIDLLNILKRGFRKAASRRQKGIKGKEFSYFAFINEIVQREN